MKDYDEIENAFKKIGVCLKDSDGNFRTWYDIFEEVAEIWNKTKSNEDRALKHRERLIKTYKDKTALDFYIKCCIKHLDGRIFD